MDISKKDIIKYCLYFLVFTIIIVFCLIFGRKSDNLKLYKQFDYVFGKDVGYTKEGIVSDLPNINILSDEVNLINKEIANNYYNVVLNDLVSYYYSYSLYNDILSLFIVSNVYDESEYGNITYYSYNIRLSDGHVLNDGEFLARLSIDENVVLNKVDEKIKSFYDIDSLNKSLSIDEYKRRLISDNIFVYTIRDDVLYAYKVINYTQDIVHEYTDGNIYEYKIMDLK